jgi:hypothetical protein
LTGFHPKSTSASSICPIEARPVADIANVDRISGIDRVDDFIDPVIELSGIP